jgi:site-specific recombinase XerD
MVEQFLNTITNPHTRDAYTRDVTRFLAWLGEDELGTLEPAELLDYVTHLQGQGAAPTSINRQLSSVRSFLRWAALTGRVTSAVYSAAQVVKSVKTPKTLPRPLTLAEVDRLLAQPDLTTLAGARDYAFIQFALATGARLDEIVALDIDTIDFDQRQVVVWGKGDKERPVFFDDDAAAALIAYLTLRGGPATGPLFANENGTRISHRWPQRMLRIYGERAGVEAHPHKLRRTFAVEALNATGDIRSVQEMLGHSDIRTTQRYTPLATDHLKAVHQAVAARRGRSRVLEPLQAAVVTARERVAVEQEQR